MYSSFSTHLVRPIKAENPDNQVIIRVYSYPDPGTDQYVLGAPFLPYMKVTLENGKALEIKAPKVSDKNRYVHSVSLNGKPYTKGYISQEEIMKGGVLIFEMSSKPNKSRVFKGEDKPYSLE